MTNAVSETLPTGRHRPARKARTVTCCAYAWIAVVALTAVLAPVIAPRGSDVQNLSAPFQGPGGSHLLGTDELGRELLVRLLYGARPTLVATAIVVVLTVVLGGSAGLAAGYLRGRFDDAVSAVFDVLQSVPPVLISLVVFAVFPYDLYVVMAATAVFLSPIIYRVVRGAALTLGGELYVTSARATGLSHRAVLRRHLAPRLADLIRVQASMIAAVALTTEVGLGFLSLDVAPPAPSWGGMLSDATQYLTSDPWMMLPPLLAIAVTIVALGVLGEVVQSPAGARRRSRRLRRAVRGVVLVPRQRVGGRADGLPAGGVVGTDEDDVLLRVRDLTVSTVGAQPVKLVDHVSFDVRRGEVLGLVGESGAGKSVMVRALVRVFRNTVVEGTVLLGGVDLVTAGEGVLAGIRGKRIAYVGQDPMSALDPMFRVGNQLVEAVRRHRGLGRQQARDEALRLLEAVRIQSPEEAFRKYPFEISGGQAQRVAIALALAGEPDLLIADEPTTALDVTIQKEVLGLLKELRRQRELAIVLVTHDWGVVADMCDRVLTVYAGEIVEIVETRDVLKHPAHPYTAALRRADPHLQPKGSRLLVITGRMPSAHERPPGCRFAERCPMAADECGAHPPLSYLDVDETGHASRCVHGTELRQGVTHV
ncbi:dipeptide/oligopeptide/nickel ABC transporter permease/ATP-binding protein [Streptomyces sp. NPDC005538]|uniref:dipeptide/oligopeptide/nickel ABC transporter permease/ATP-binding protein n=1 Tax=unclassified Streptomyces TaxID=2593676 RepID=UPI0033A2463B